MWPSAIRVGGDECWCHDLKSEANARGYSAARKPFAEGKWRYCRELLTLPG
jgi:hypothetical protein